MSNAFETLEGGVQTTVQDYPGRIGYWDIGVPPSGPMDPVAFRLANLLVGNLEGEAGLEITAVGPKLKFRDDSVVAITGANIQASVNGEDLPMWESLRLRKGSVLSIGMIRGKGFRAYLGIAGGIDVPVFLGGKSTFPQGHLGGFEGRPLRNGDVLKIGASRTPLPDIVGRKVDSSTRPAYQSLWEIGATPGPHADPDFLTADDMAMLFSHRWRVHYNSNRSGYRLIGPKPRWARIDGGEAGRHPSNIHDTPYPIGAVNLTGDMPVILTADGPSLGGFVSFATVVSAELWKVGQAVPGTDQIMFRKFSLQDALKIRTEQETLIHTSIVSS